MRYRQRAAICTARYSLFSPPTRPTTFCQSIPPLSLYGIGGQGQAWFFLHRKLGAAIWFYTFHLPPCKGRVNWRRFHSDNPFWAASARTQSLCVYALLARNSLIGHDLLERDTIWHKKKHIMRSAPICRLPASHPALINPSPVFYNLVILFYGINAYSTYLITLFISTSVWGLRLEDLRILCLVKKLHSTTDLPIHPSFVPNPS